MSYLKHLQRTPMHPDTRWVVKLTSDGRIREVKQIFDPEEYIKGKKPRELITQEKLIKLLKNDK
jgi:hypothetical protein